MATKVTRDRLFFAFEPKLNPAIQVQQGEEVLLETHDCFEGQIQKPQDLVDKLDWNHVNPATGPVYIEGAKPDDVLRVDLLEVKVGSPHYLFRGFSFLEGNIPVELCLAVYRGNKFTWSTNIYQFTQDSATEGRLGVERQLIKSI